MVYSTVEEPRWCSRGDHYPPPGTYFPLAGRRRWCSLCCSAYQASRRHLYREKKNRQAREAHIRLRAEVLAHYGINGVPMCHCCGERRLEFLGIDHIEGGGVKHKKQIRTSLYQWLKKHLFPEGFRVLCHNC